MKCAARMLALPRIVQTSWSPSAPTTSAEILCRICTLEKKKEEKTNYCLEMSSTVHICLICKDFSNTSASVTYWILIAAMSLLLFSPLFRCIKRLRPHTVIQVEISQTVKKLRWSFCSVGLHRLPSGLQSHLRCVVFLSTKVSVGSRRQKHAGEWYALFYYFIYLY